MSSHELPPLEQWFRPAEPGFVRLVDPVDGRYDPSAPPSYIQSDPQLRRGLEHLEYFGRFIKVELSLGPEAIYAEEGDLPLGVSGEALLLPSWVDGAVSETHAFGHNIEPDAPNVQPYDRRVRQIIGSLTGTQAFSYVPDRLEHEAGAGAQITQIGSVVNDAYERLERAVEQGGQLLYDAEEQGLEAQALLGQVVFANAANWYAAAKIGFAAQRQQSEVFPDHWRSFVINTPENISLVSKLDSFGVHVDEMPFRRMTEAWNPDMTWLIDVEVTGRFELG